LLKHRIHRSTLIVTGHISRIRTLLLQDEAASGKFLLAATAAAIIWMNSPWSDAYETLWAQHFTIGIGDWQLSETLRHWINEGLMAVFFLMAGLEIKREIVQGELRTARAASLPIAAALGGMALPAVLYAIFNNGHAGSSGWAIPMTTDTAFAVGALALLGKRIPVSLRIFLLTAVVVDDIGAIIIITLFYSDGISLLPLAIAGGLLMIIGLLQWLRLLRFSVFIVLGVGMWLAIHASGVHAAIAGALLGLSAPIISRRKDKRAIAGRLERSLIPMSAFVVMPLFALANAGVQLRLGAFQSEDAVRMGLGLGAGLIVGKTFGILGAAWLVVRLGVVRLPQEVTWRMVAGVGMLAGIGFTLSIFIAALAFEYTPLFDAAKMSIFIASIISAGLGLSLLRRATRHRVPAAQTTL
jgi:NhaA family Na+:H+ antiporter